MKKPKYILCRHNRKKEFIQAVKDIYVLIFFFLIPILFLVNIIVIPSKRSLKNEIRIKFDVACNFTNQTTYDEMLHLWLKEKIKGPLMRKHKQEKYDKLEKEFEYQRNLWLKCIDKNQEAALSMIKEYEDDLIYFMKVQLFVFLILSNFVRIFLQRKTLIWKVAVLLRFFLSICLCLVPAIIFIVVPKEKMVQKVRNEKFMVRFVLNDDDEVLNT